MEPEIKNHLLKINKEYYKVSYKDGRPYLEKVKKKDVERKLKLVGEMTDKLKDSLNQEIVMKEALGKMRLKELEKLNKMIISGKRYKPKTREHHCADMKVGNFIIPIVD